jgi:hypothetical protein
MSFQIVLMPLFVEVLLTFGLLIWLGLRRRVDLVSGKVRPQQIALREPNWPPETQKIAYAFSNQFELPVLFYVLTILEMVTQHADYIFLVLAWIFVLSRLVQAYVHTTNNIVQWRGAWFGVGAIALALAWLIFMVRILLALP